jgi:type II secretory pathway pseudopilin PulG
MHLRGQHGYAMVVLLVGMSVAAILMSAAMPVWHQSIQREKEAELIFRGNQYVRAIGLFQRRSGPGVLPPNLDVLVSNHFLRKKYKDPITGQDFDLLSPVQQAAPAGGQPGGAQPGSAQPGGAQRGGAPTGRGAAPLTPATTGAVVSAGAQAAAGGRGAVAGIMGVASKSKDASIRIYNGRTHYNEWQFLYVQTSNAPGSPGGGARGAGPGQGGPNTGAPQPFGAPGNGGRGAPQLPGRGRGGFTGGSTPAQGGRGPAAPPAAPPTQPAPARGSQPTTPTSPFAPRR